MLGGSACLNHERIDLDLSKSNSVRVSPVTGVNTNFFNAPEKLGNEDVWNAVEEAKIPVLRFPGGTRGNSYDWVTGKIQTSRHGNIGSAGQNENNTVPMDNFMSRAKKAGASVSYVLNITDSPDSIQKLARHWRSTNAPISWVELGNEYYLPDLINEIGGPAGYLNKARQALTALRAGGYRGAVGLMVAPEEMPGRENSSTSFQSWNEELARADVSGFDAVILHYYPSLDSAGFGSIYEDGPSNLSSTIRKLRRQFPHQQVWITEWNLGKPADAPQFNTLWHALFDLQILKVMLENHVSLACYHVLTGRGWELLGPNHFTLNDNGKGLSDLSRRVPYFVFQMVDEARSDGATYVPAQENSQRTTLSNGVNYVAFRTHSELRIVAWTSTEASVDIQVRMNALAPKFLEGKLLHGGLEETNGSLLRMKYSKATWKEKIKPVLISSPRLQGPGAVLLRYSIEKHHGNADRGVSRLE